MTTPSPYVTTGGHPKPTRAGASPPGTPVRCRRPLQTFGDGGHGQGDGDLEVVDGPTDPGAAVDGVVEVADVDEPDGDADEGDDLGELLPKLVQLLLQGGLVLLGGRHLVPDLPDLRVDPRGHHDADGFARPDVGALGGRGQVGEMWWDARNTWWDVGMGHEGCGDTIGRVVGHGERVVGRGGTPGTRGGTQGTRGGMWGWSMKDVGTPWDMWWDMGNAWGDVVGHQEHVVGRGDGTRGMWGHHGTCGGTWGTRGEMWWDMGNTWWDVVGHQEHVVGHGDGT